MGQRGQNFSVIRFISLVFVCDGPGRMVDIISSDYGGILFEHDADAGGVRRARG